MVETREIACPNCGAPLAVPLGDVEVECDFCGSHLRFVPGSEELEVVRIREAVRSRERLAREQMELESRRRESEAEEWRKLAGKVAIASVPVLGRSAGRAAFHLAFDRAKGCLACGCLVMVAVLAVAGSTIAAWLGLTSR